MNELKHRRNYVECCAFASMPIKSKMIRDQFIILVLIQVIISQLPTADCTIDCFKCVSWNFQNKKCDDPFHNNVTTEIYQSPCMGGRKGRDGLFPATSCVKLVGVFDDNGDHLTVRSCALDSGTLTADTEIVRMSHCGAFYYNERYVRGCIQSCNDADACNYSSLAQIPDFKFLLSAAIALKFLAIINTM